MYAYCPSLLSAGFFDPFRGLVALITPGTLPSAVTVSPIAFLGAESVSLPLSVCTTTGLDPYAWSGSLLDSRSCDWVEPVPGSDRLSLVWLPTDFAAATTATASTSQSPITTQWCRAHARPRR